MKKIIISGWYGHNNTGDEAILTSILSSFRNRIPNVDIIILSNSPQKVSKQHDVDAIPYSPIGLRKLLKELRNADLFILGGGNILQDRTSIFNLIFYLSQLTLAKLMNKPIFFYALGVGPIDTSPGRILTRIIVNKVDIISVRDEESKEQLIELGITNPPIYVTADPAVTLLPISPKENIFKSQKNKRPYIAICVRHWFNLKYNIPTKYIFKYNLWFSKEKIKFENFKKIIVQIADYLVDTLDAELFFIPFFYDRDDKLNTDIASMVNNKNKVNLIPSNYTPQEIMYIIGQMDLVIGMRLHSLILASAMNVPVVGITYQPKVRVFLQMIGQESRAIGIDDVNFEKMRHIIDETWNNREQIKKELKPRIKELQESALSNVNLVLQLLEGRNKV